MMAGLRNKQQYCYIYFLATFQKSFHEKVFNDCVSFLSLFGSLPNETLNLCVNNPHEMTSCSVVILYMDCMSIYCFDLSVKKFLPQ